MFGDKSKNIKLTEKELKKLKKTLSKKEYQELEKRIKKSKEDKLLDAIMYVLVFDEEDY